MLAGVQRRTQVNYERGQRLPDAGYLAKIAEHGADVQYIVTGKRVLSEEQHLADLERLSDAWETLELALAKFDRTLAPEKKRKAADALYRASRQQTASQEQLTSLVLDLAA